jgi:hypothetical protein
MKRGFLLIVPAVATREQTNPVAVRRQPCSNFFVLVPISFAFPSHRAREKREFIGLNIVP